MIPVPYDLHLHSCLSPCGDDDMTPANIAGMAMLKGLKLLALTDHNSCENCPAFFKVCESYGITPVAGMELSTAEDIHVVCYFPTLEAALACSKEVHDHLPHFPNKPERFGNQFIMNEEDEQIGTEELLLISATDLWMGDALALLRSYGGMVHPAHIDRESSGMVAILGTVPEEYGFTTIELNDRANYDEYLRRFPHLRDKRLLVNSDAHRLWAISEAENFLHFTEEEAADPDKLRAAFFRRISGINHD